MSYNVRFPTDRLMKDFEKNLSKVQPKKLIDNIIKRVRQLSDNPKPEGKSFKPLTAPHDVHHYVAHYRLRIGNYRVLYDIDGQKKIVWIFVLRIRNEKTYK